MEDCCYASSSTCALNILVLRWCWLEETVKQSIHVQTWSSCCHFLWNPPRCFSHKQTQNDHKSDPPILKFSSLVNYSYWQKLELLPLNFEVNRCQHKVNHVSTQSGGCCDLCVCPWSTEAFSRVIKHVSGFLLCCLLWPLEDNRLLLLESLIHVSHKSRVFNDQWVFHIVDATDLSLLLTAGMSVPDIPGMLPFRQILLKKEWCGWIRLMNDTVNHHHVLNIRSVLISQSHWSLREYKGWSFCVTSADKQKTSFS